MEMLDLLKCLDVEASTESAELALSSMFEGVPYSTLLENFMLVNEKKMIDFANLKPESALYWKCLAKHLKSENAEDYLEEILPDLTAFCSYLKDYILMETPEEEDPQETAVKLMEKDFVSQQLIRMCSYFDLSDEVGRQSLSALIHTLLLNSLIGETCIKDLCEIFSLLHSPMARVEHLAEIIDNLREPEVAESVLQTPIVINKEPAALTDDEQRKNKIKLAKVSVKINQIRDELEDCVRTLNLEKAQELKIQLQELDEDYASISAETSRTPLGTPLVPCTQAKIPDEEEEHKLLDDPQTLSRCLFIIREILSNSDITSLCSILRSHHDNLILPCLKSEHPGVRKNAVEALALTCLLSKELAQQHLLLFVQISQMDIEEIQAVALQGVFDFLLLYGIEEFNSAAEDMVELPGFIPDADGSKDEENADGQSQAVGNMISLLTKMLETDNSEARTLAAEGLCKLLLTSQISSPKLLSHLIILWYNPTTEEDHLLRHMLGVFFPLYASLGGTNQECLCSAVLPTLQTLFNAPMRSPLADIDVEDVANFMVSITSPSIISNKSKEKINAHDTLVFNICAEIIAFPDRDYVKTLIRCLNQLSLSPNNFDSLKQIEILAQKIKKKLNEKALLAGIEKFENNVKNLLKFAPLLKEEETDDETVLAPDEDTDAETRSQSFRRKRTLYTTQSDLQLTSDFDSETDRTPSKRRPEAPSMVTSNGCALKQPEKDVVIKDETEDFEDIEQRDNNSALNDSNNELELVSINLDEESKQNFTSSDLFDSSQSSKDVVPAIFVSCNESENVCESDATLTHCSDSSSIETSVLSNVLTQSSRNRLLPETLSKNKRAVIHCHQKNESSSSYYTACSSSEESSSAVPCKKKQKRSSERLSTSNAGPMTRRKSSHASTSPVTRRKASLVSSSPTTRARSSPVTRRKSSIVCSSPTTRRKSSLVSSSPTIRRKSSLVSSSSTTKRKSSLVSSSPTPRRKSSLVSSSPTAKRKSSRISSSQSTSSTPPVEKLSSRVSKKPGRPLLMKSKKVDTSISQDSDSSQDTPFRRSNRTTKGKISKKFEN